MGRETLRAVLMFVAMLGAARANAAGDLSKSWPENDLERLLVAGATDHAKSGDFVRALLKSEICALADKLEPDAKGHIALIAVKAPDGEFAGPVFTSRHRATDVFGEKQPVVCGKADVLLNALRGSRVVVDPGQPFGFIYTADELDRILGVEWTITGSPAFQPPTDAPAAMIAALKAALAAEPRVSQAWLSLAYWPDKKEWSWFLDVKTTLDADAAHVMIRNASSRIDMLGRPLDTAVNAPIKDPAQGIMLLDRN